MGADVAASEGGAKSQNTWSWMDGLLGERWEDEVFLSVMTQKWKRWVEWDEMNKTVPVPELCLETVWVHPLVWESSSLESSSSSSIDAQARSLASAMANCSATPDRKTHPINQRITGSGSGDPLRRSYGFITSRMLLPAVTSSTKQWLVFFIMWMTFRIRGKFEKIILIWRNRNAFFCFPILLMISWPLIVFMWPLVEVLTPMLVTTELTSYTGRPGLCDFFHDFDNLLIYVLNEVGVILQPCLAVLFRD